MKMVINCAATEIEYKNNEAYFVCFNFNHYSSIDNAIKGLRDLSYYFYYLMSRDKMRSAFKVI